MRKKYKRILPRVLAGALALLTAFSPMTALASDIEGDMGEPIPAEAEYTVYWMENSEEELAHEVRVGQAGSEVSVEAEDLTVLGEEFMFRNDDQRNVQTGVVAEDGSLALKLYFDTVVQEEPAEDVSSDADTKEEPDASNESTEEQPDTSKEEADTSNDSTEEQPAADTAKEESVIVYTVEWRNPSGELIQSMTREGKQGETVSVTEEDKNFDTTGRYFFNEDAEGNVLSGEVSEDLTLVLYFDDTQAVTASEDCKDEQGHFIYDYTTFKSTGNDYSIIGYIHVTGDCEKEIRPLHGYLPYGSTLNLKDTFCDWDSYLEYNIYDYEFVRWYSRRSSNPYFQNMEGTYEGDLTKFDGITFTGQSKKSNSDYFLVDAELRATIRSKFSVNTQISGAQSELITGDTVAYDNTKTYSLSDYVKLPDTKDDNVAYVFEGYEISSGSGVFGDKSDLYSTFVPDNGETVITAKYKAIDVNTEGGIVQLNLHIDGLEHVDISYDDLAVVLDSDTDKHIKLCDLNRQMPSNYVYTFKGYTIDEGSGTLDDPTDENTNFHFSKGRTKVTAHYEASDFRDDRYYTVFTAPSPITNLDIEYDTRWNPTLPDPLVSDSTFLSPDSEKEKASQLGYRFSHWKEISTKDNVKTYEAQWGYKDVGVVDVTTNVKLAIDGLEEPVTGPTSAYYIQRDATGSFTAALVNLINGSSHTQVKSLINKDIFNTDLYQYKFKQYVLTVLDSGSFKSSQYYAHINDPFSEEDADFLWCSSHDGDTASYGRCKVNITAEYDVVPIANELKFETILIGDNNTSSSQSAFVSLNERVKLSDFVDQSLFDTDSCSYEFKEYSLLSGDGSIILPNNINSEFIPGSPLNGSNHIAAVFEATKKSELSYDTKGGSAIDSSYPEDGRFMVTRRIPKKDGFVFLGWSLSEEATEVDYIGGDTLSGSKDRTLYAVWSDDTGSGGDSGSNPSQPTAKTYTLSYDTKTDMVIDPQKSNTGSFTVTRRTPVKENHTFVGWSLSEDPKDATEVDYFSGDVFPAQADVTLHAVFIPNKVVDTFKITYDSKGGSEVKPTKAEDGRFMVTRREPEKKGYVFSGWSVDEKADGIDYVGGDIIAAASDVKLYAVWVKEKTEQKYVLSYDTDGGSEVLDTESIDGKFMVTRRTPKKDGKVFLGWSLFAGDNDIDYIGGDFVLADKNVTLYAVYADASDEPVTETYTITYDTRGGSSVAETNSYQGIFTVTRRTPDLEGKLFAGWTLDPDSTNPSDVDYVGGDQFPAASDITLYALYKNADIVVNTNGGSDVETTVTVVENTYIIQITVPSKPGYDFPGWDTNGDGQPDVTPGEPIETENPDQTIDAVWQLKATPAQYVTTDDSIWLSDIAWDNQTTEAEASVVRSLDDALTDENGRAVIQIPATTPTRSGHVFLGWDLGTPTLAEGNTTYYQAGDKIYMDEIDSLYETGMRFTAVWDTDHPSNPGDNTNPENPGGGMNPGGDSQKPDGGKPSTPVLPGVSGGTGSSVSDITKNTPNSGLTLTGGSKYVNRSGMQVSSSKGAPRTGDTAQTASFAILMITSLIVLIAVLEKRKHDAE